MISKCNVRKKILQLLATAFFISSSLLSTVGSTWFYTDGSNVSNCWNLGPAMQECLMPPQFGAYLLWSNAWKIPTYGTISFSATGMNDLTIGVSVIDPSTVQFSGDFYSTLTNGTNMYEFVIGGWANTTSVIRKGAQANPVKVVYSGIPKAQDSQLGVNLFVRYKIIFYQDAAHNNKDTIAVYSLDPRDTNWRLLIRYKDTSLIAGAKRWFSFSSWDTTVFYKDISASNSTDLPFIV